jgi:hypothetical protein
MAQRKEKIGTVILYQSQNYDYDPDARRWVQTADDKGQTVEILDVERIEQDHLIAGRYVLPLADAAIHNSGDGLVYSYNASLPYLTEIAHLGEVERNIIVGQAFLYAGRASAAAKPNLLMFGLVALLGVLAVIGMLK